MSERQAAYPYTIQSSEQQLDTHPPTTFDLGQHTLELLDDQALLLLDNATQGSKEIVQLDGEETYRLFVTLQTMFRATNDETVSERGQEKDVSGAPGEHRQNRPTR